MRDFGSTPDVYLRKCLDIIIGDFDGMEIIGADPLLGHLFFFSFLIAFNCMFVNIFFAIIDRFFIYAKPPPINWQKKLKPVLGNLACFQCIEWDHDLEMEKTDFNPLAKTGPPDRAQAAKRAMTKIEEIRESYKDDDAGDNYDCKIVTDNEVIGPTADDKLHEVVTWARDEARRYLELLRQFSEEKVTYANEAAFINVKKKDLKKNLQDDKDKMLEAERQLKYAVQFHEKSAQANLDTVCRAMLLLEHKIGRKMSLKHKLEMELGFLKEELGKLQYTNEELQRQTKEDDDAPNEEELSGDGDAPSVLMEAAENKKEDLAIDDGGAVEDVDNAAPAMGNTQTSMAKRTRQELIDKVPTAQY
jgi:hypothetical protein